MLLAAAQNAGFNQVLNPVSDFIYSLYSDWHMKRTGRIINTGCEQDFWNICDNWRNFYE